MLTVLRSLSKFIARKRNFVSSEVVFQRLHSSITLEIWKRSAGQIRSCWPLAAFLVPLNLDLWSLSAASAPGLVCSSGARIQSSLLLSHVFLHVVRLVVCGWYSCAILVFVDPEPLWSLKVDPVFWN